MALFLIALLFIFSSYFLWRSHKLHGEAHRALLLICRQNWRSSGVCFLSLCLDPSSIAFLFESAIIASLHCDKIE
jgi:hypothetical protein